MHRLPALLSGCFFAVTLLTGSAYAAERVALLIGNAKYQHATTLKNSAGDAEAMAAALRAAGFAVTVAIDAPRDKMLRTLRDFGKEAETADWAVVFFAGHGLEINGVTYLVPIDAKLETDRDVDYEAVTLQSALTAVAPKKFRLIIYDAARDNPFARTMSRETRPRPGAVDIGISDTSTLIAYATRAGGVALEGEGGNSPFTEAIIKNISTPGLDISVLFRRVRDDVMKATGRRQEPSTYGSLPAQDFVFIPK